MKRLILILFASAFAIQPALAQMPVPHELLGHKRSTFKVPRTRAWDEENYKYFGGGPDLENECGGAGHCFHRPAVWSCPHFIVPPYQAKWIIRAELLGFTREEPAEQDLLFRTTDDAVLFSLDDSNFSQDLAYRVSAQHNLTEFFGVEAVYINLQDPWQAETRIDDVNPIELRAAGIVINSPVDPFDLFSETRFEGAEANLRYYVNNFAASYIAGFRWVDIDEIFRAGVDGAPPSLQVQTTNQLFGGQIGVETQHWVNYGILRIDSSIKGGIYQNQFQQRTTLDPIAVAARDSDIAWVGEAEVAFNFPITKHTYLRASYRLIHVAGLALADEQFNRTDLTVPAAGFKNNGEAIYHGWSVGLEAWW